MRKLVIRLTSLTALLLALGTGILLFWVSQQVQQVEREHKQLMVSNLQEEESIRVLRAEWDYLNRPERLEELSTKYLNMAPASAETLVQSISAIPEPEDSTGAPEEAVPVSTAAEKKTQKPAVVKLPPPVLDQKEKSQESDFNRVLNDVTGEAGQ